MRMGGGVGRQRNDVTRDRRIPPIGAMYKFRTSISARKYHGFRTGVPGATNEEAMAWLLGFRACTRHIHGL